MSSKLPLYQLQHKQMPTREKVREIYNEGIVMGKNSVSNNIVRHNPLQLYFIAADSQRAIL